MHGNDQVLGMDREVQAEKVAMTVLAMSSGTDEPIPQDFRAFQAYLAKRVEMAQDLGFGDEQLAAIALKVAGYLAEHEEPRNREEYLLRELWKVGTEDERHKLAQLLVKLARSTPDAAG
ncbi:DUF3243 domain-containing protein [Paenibacillus glycinis]|uniref:DUF3243 family protein n=1 Tax=Paenibacillus glycinis TaxID=2697035 RepID=A0ABW9XXX9_9BACL|nr:DUF3243 domain-containing protein [Paenibacillus glycinis]NBD27134.1 DUF3243 family protein [Paenibacillus glycinis]